MQSLNEEIELVENVSTFSNEPNEPFYQSAEFGVGMAFVLVVFALAKPVSRLVKNMLIKRRERIAEQIDEAQKLRDDAQLLLAEYEKRYVNAEHEADAILQKAQANIARQKKNVMNALNADMKKRRADAERNMSLTLLRAQNKIYTSIGQRAITTVKSYILKEINAKTHATLIDASIERVLNHVKK